MKNKNLEAIEENYELELESIVKKILEEKAKKILLQFPDGFKPYSIEIKKKLESLLKDYKCEIFIWLDSCFGACDIPLEVERLGIDLLIQFGHSNWSFKDKTIKVI